MSKEGKLYESLHILYGLLSLELGYEVSFFNWLAIEWFSIFVDMIWSSLTESSSDSRNISILISVVLLLVNDLRARLTSSSKVEGSSV